MYFNEQLHSKFEFNISSCVTCGNYIEDDLMNVGYGNIENSHNIFCKCLI